MANIPFTTDDDLQLTRLTLDRFMDVAVDWRQQAQDGDRTTRLVADALESVLRRRIAMAMAVRRDDSAAPRPAARRWWKCW